MTSTKIKAKQHDSYETFTLISVLLPVVGIILGIVMLTKEQKLDKKLGEHCMALSILFLLIHWFLLGLVSTLAMATY